jgi:hypothetical protein
MKSSPTDRHVYLLGRPPLGEFLGFVTEAQGAAADISQLGNEWRTANDHIRDLEASEPGIADNPSLAEPDEKALADRVLTHPVVRKTFAVVPYSIKIVELDHLVVYQKHINIDFVEQLKQSMADPSGIESVYSMAFPLGRGFPPVSRARVAQNAFAFVSPSTDIRLLDAVVLEPDQIVGYRPPGFPAGVVALVVGFGSNLLSAIHVENRLVLNNGSHRAYALRDLGITRAPCLIQHVSRREELNVIARGELVDRTDVYLRSPRPPILKDYFDPLLRKEILVPSKVRQLRVIFGEESVDLPRQ